MALSAAAKQDAKEWGQYRAQALIQEMRELAGNYAMEFDADREKYLAEALKATNETLNSERPKQR